MLNVHVECRFQDVGRTDIAAVVSENLQLGFIQWTSRDSYMRPHRAPFLDKVVIPATLTLQRWAQNPCILAVLTLVRSDRHAVSPISQRLVHRVINRFTDEANGSVAQAKMGTARM